MPNAKKKKLTPAQYPAAPRIVGVDWLELPVARPKRSAQIYQAIGLEPRSTVGPHPRLAAGGVELLLRRAQKTKDTPQASGPPPTGVRLRLAVDDLQAKRQQLIAMGLKPGPMKPNKRGDHAFEWRDPDGHVFCFVGPARKPDDRTLS